MSTLILRILYILLDTKWDEQAGLVSDQSLIWKGHWLSKCLPTYSFHPNKSFYKWAHLPKRLLCVSYVQEELVAYSQQNLKMCLYLCVKNLAPRNRFYMLRLHCNAMSVERNAPWFWISGRKKVCCLCCLKNDVLHNAIYLHSVFCKALKQFYK